MPGCWSSFLDIFPCFRKDPSYKQFNQATKYFDQYNNTKDLDDLSTAVSHFQLALRSRRRTKDEHAHYSFDSIIPRYSDALWVRYESDPKRYSADMHQAIELDEEVCAIWEKQNDQTTTSSQYSRKLLDLGNSYFSQYLKDPAGGESSFAKAIDKYERVLFKMSTVSPGIRRAALIKYGFALITWCDDHVEKPLSSETRQRLRKGIAFMDQALDMGVPQDLDTAEQKKLGATRETCLLKLAIAHYISFQDGGEIGALDAAIKSNRELLALISYGHPDYVYAKFDLAQQLFHKYSHERSQTNHQLLIVPSSQTLMEVETVAKTLRQELDQLPGSGSDDMKNDLDELLRTVDAHSSAHSGSRQRSRSPSPAPSSRNGSSNVSNN